MNAQEPALTRQGLSTPEELLTGPQVMARLQLGRFAVYDLLRTRQLASITLGRALRIPAHAFTDCIRTRLEQEAAA
ncbi:helix-turn-helix domain-containing protein [Streptomyces sp. SudanB182_2057]|uniref:helix-turn-helix domain-containing protein n=1 Tax=Streptomyces sp. SudanB182_2057 TaxID=3035281 RepID=UPI003F558A1A